METILDRIEKIALNEGVKIAAMERKIGASKGVLSRAINNRTNVHSKWLQEVVKNFPAYSEEWLLTGNGDMLKVPGMANTIGKHHAVPVGGDDVNTGSAKQNRLLSDFESKINQLHKLNEKLQQSEKDLQVKVGFLEQQVTLHKENIETLRELLKLYKKDNS